MYNWNHRCWCRSSPSLDFCLPSTGSDVAIAYKKLRYAEVDQPPWVWPKHNEIMSGAGKSLINCSWSCDYKDSCASHQRPVITIASQTWQQSKFLTHATEKSCVSIIIIHGTVHNGSSDINNGGQIQHAIVLILTIMQKLTVAWISWTIMLHDFHSLS